MKIRILNGGHAAIAYPAGLLDIHFAHEAMEDAQIATFLETLTRREIIPVLPTVRDRLAAGGNVEGLALVSAMWCRYCYGEAESGKTIPPNDPSWDRLRAAARSARSDPRA